MPKARCDVRQPHTPSDAELRIMASATQLAGIAVDRANAAESLRQYLLPIIRERLRRARREELATGLDEFLAITRDRLERLPS